MFIFRRYLSPCEAFGLRTTTASPNSRPLLVPPNESTSTTSVRSDGSRWNTKGRNVVERSFARTRQSRGPATRYDKLVVTYRTAVVLSVCIMWNRPLRRHTLVIAWGDTSLDDDCITGPVAASTTHRHWCCRPRRRTCRCRARRAAEGSMLGWCSLVLLLGGVVAGHGHDGFSIDLPLNDRADQT